jgi:hypothetical protein
MRSEALKPSNPYPGRQDSSKAPDSARPQASYPGMESMAGPGMNSAFGMPPGYPNPYEFGGYGGMNMGMGMYGPYGGYPMGPGGHDPSMSQMSGRMMDPMAGQYPPPYGMYQGSMMGYGGPPPEYGPPPGMDPSQAPPGMYGYGPPGPPPGAWGPQ